MILNIHILRASLKHDTQLVGPMSPYIVVYDKDGIELKRTGLKSGRKPVWNNENFRVSEKLRGLQFIVFDHETLKSDDFVGKGVLSFSDIQGLPNAIVPICVSLYYQEGSSAGTLDLEVSADVQPNPYQVQSASGNMSSAYQSAGQFAPPGQQYADTNQSQWRHQPHTPSAIHHHPSGISLTTTGPVTQQFNYPQLTANQYMPSNIQQQQPFMQQSSPSRLVQSPVVTYYTNRR